MKIVLTVVAMLLTLGGCAADMGSSATNPESAQSKCKGTWDARTGTCIGG